MYNRMSRWNVCLGAVITGLVASGCGAPDFGAMKPTVYKPSALVLLVDGPTHWQESDVTSLVNAAQKLDVKVQSTTSPHLTLKLNQAMRIQGLGMLAVVFPGAIPDNAMTFAKSHRGVRFEFIGTGRSSLSAYNVRQVVPDQQAAAFATGWLAGNMAKQANAHSVGFVPSASPGSINSVQAELAGLYDADPTVQLVPATPTGLPPVSIPGIDLSSGSVPTSDIKALQSRHAFFASLDFGNQSATGISLPLPSHLGADLASFVQGKWQGGVETTVDAPVVLYNSVVVPQAVQSALTTEVTGMVANHSIYQTAWKAVPKNIQTSWGQIAGI